MRKTTIAIAIFSLLAFTSLSFWLIDVAPDKPAIKKIESTPLPTTVLPTKEVATHDVGKHFIIGHWASTPLASTTALIAEYNVAGVIIMSAPEDPEKIKEWTDTWRQISSSTLIIAIDQEGGVVSRLKGKNFIATGQSDITDEDTAYSVGLTRGQELHSLGINLNFAPVLDTATNPDSFMFNRVFRNREQSPHLASAMITGMMTSGVIGVAKHFPGHDDTNEDSHLTLPTVNYASSSLDDFLSPFRTLIENNPPLALMTAHVAFPSVDPLPATLSSYWLTTYLRKNLNYQGVIITDDMIMDAIDNTWPPEEASLMALNAGADIILYAAEPGKVKDAIETIQQALDDGRISPAQLEASQERIETLRTRIK